MTAEIGGRTESTHFVLRPLTQGIDTIFYVEETIQKKRNDGLPTTKIIPRHDIIIYEKKPGQWKVATGAQAIALTQTKKPENLARLILIFIFVIIIGVKYILPWLQTHIFN